MSFWIGGVNSFIHPCDLPKQNYAWGENVVNRGGIIQTRPGYRLVSSILGTTIQGMTSFTPRGGEPKLVAVVDGKIMVAGYPGFNFVQLSGVTLSATAKQVFFCRTLKSVKRNADDSIAVITPTPILIIQDGTSRAVSWDGITARTLNPAGPQETPIGSFMSWTSSRLWVANGARLYVSDIADPVSFTEGAYLAERANFDLPDDITGMIETADNTGLLVFTSKTTTAFKSFIRNRPDWALTQEFQKIILPGIGCVAGKTPVNQYGTTYWLTERGFISLDAALFSQQSSKVITVDSEMMRSKKNISPLLEGSVSCAYENMLLVSVPSGDKRNSHTWVMDQAPLDKATQTGVWTGIWTGTRPVEFTEGFFGGRRRLYYVSYDYTGYQDTRIHVWEAFQANREDADGRITCQFETGISTSDVMMKFKYAEIEIVELLGRVDLTVYMGGTKGPWHEIGQFTLNAEKGSIGSVLQPLIFNESILQAYRPQARTIYTEEFGSQNSTDNPEYSGYVAGIDKGFALLLEWQGRMGVREIRMVFDPKAASLQHGLCVPDEDGLVNAIGSDGEAIVSEVVPDEIEPPTPTEPIDQPEVLPPFTFWSIYPEFPELSGVTIVSIQLYAHVSGEMNSATGVLVREWVDGVDWDIPEADGFHSALITITPEVIADTTPKVGGLHGYFVLYKITTTENPTPHNPTLSEFPNIGGFFDSALPVPTVEFESGLGLLTNSSPTPNSPAYYIRSPIKGVSIAISPQFGRWILRASSLNGPTAEYTDIYIHRGINGGPVFTPSSTIPIDTVILAHLVAGVDFEDDSFPNPFSIDISQIIADDDIPAVNGFYTYFFSFVVSNNFGDPDPYNPHQDAIFLPTTSQPAHNLYIKCILPDAIPDANSVAFGWKTPEDIDPTTVNTFLRHTSVVFTHGCVVPVDD